MRASGGASAAQDPGDADRNGVLELGKHGELGCKPAQVITARHGATRSTAKGAKREGGSCADKDRDARAKAPGAPEWQAARAMTGAQEGQDSQSQENGLDQSARRRHRNEHARNKSQRARSRERAPAGGWMSMSKIAGRSVTGQQVRICREVPHPSNEGLALQARV